MTTCNTDSGRLPQKGRPLNANQWQIILGDTEAQFTAIAAVDGNLVQFHKELGYALQIIAGNDKLQQCSTESLRSAFINVAGLGLTLNPAMKLAYLVPRRGKACLDIGYLGLLHIATIAGCIRAAKAEVARENDTFDYIDAFTQPHHKFDPFATIAKRGQVVGAYCVAVLPDGLRLVETMSREDLLKIRAASKGGDNSPWATWPDEMCKKAVIKRAYKSWPQNPRMSNAVAYVNANEGIDFEAHSAPREARPSPAALAQQTLNVAVPPEGQTFIAKVEQNIREQGLAYYEALYPNLTFDERRWIGPEGHKRLWQLGLDVDAARGQA